jgi:hypothetical protein
MSQSRKKRARVAAGLASATAGLAILTATASAAPPPPSISGADGDVWNVGTNPSYTITPADGGTVTWSTSNGAAGVGDPGAAVTVNLGSIGDGNAAISATQSVPDDPDASGAAVRSFLVDRTPPQLGLKLLGTPSAAGWYRQLVIRPDPCADPPFSLPQDACLDEAWTTDGENLTASVTVKDNALNSTTAATPAFNFDATQPVAGTGSPSQPGPNALVASEPVFKWTPGDDALSGVARYEVQVRSIEEDPDQPFEIIAKVNHTSGQGDYSAARDPDLRPEPLPERELLEWRIRTYDKAGNVRISTARRLTIDSTIPPAPSITGGPIGPTRNASPTFTWQGTQKTFLWDLTKAGTELPVRKGGGPDDSVTLNGLPDGDYTFRVTQVTDAGKESAEATRVFKVDTVAPAPPVITARPPFPTSEPATFAWTAEPGAYSHWEVIGAGGTSVAGPSDTPLTNVTLPLLAPGAYSFQVLQVDAAGNVSQSTVEPFTVVEPVLPPAPGQTTVSTASLPKRNASRLRPKAGATVPTRAPVLRWPKGPRGTTLYNLQIFRVSAKTRKLGTPIVAKVYSAFPRGRQLRAPRKRLKPGTCYVWRVWPYTGRAFTPRPLGISNFCVASRKVLAKKAAAAAARRRAAAR